MKDLIPAFRFLGIFVGVYLSLNIIYGLWISSYDKKADLATELVTNQTSGLLNLFGNHTDTKPKENSPAICIMRGNDVVISVYEGCNGINVMIVFLSFLFAFGGKRKTMIWFGLLSLAVIYVANLFRVMILYFVAANWSEYFYYAHKYVLTAMLYLIVFILWWYWIEKISGISIKRAITIKS